jgi:hypothetical protein
MATDSDVACLVLRDLSERHLLAARSDCKKERKKGRKSFASILASVVWFHLSKQFHNQGLSVPEHDVDWGKWGDGPGQFYVNVFVHDDGIIEPEPISAEIKKTLSLDFHVHIYKVHSQYGAN